MMLRLFSPDLKSINTWLRRSVPYDGCVILLIILTTQCLHAQGPSEKKRSTAVIVRGGFVEDSMKIGEPVRYYLTAKYAQDLDMIFPDSASNFTPFEFDHKQYVPTETSNGFSYDSVIYFVSTFEIDRQQTLTLPVYQLNAQDCTVFHSPVDSILLTSVVPFAVDTIPSNKLPVKAQVAYQNIPRKINYPLITILSWIGILIIGAVWIFFGKRVLRHYRIKRLRSTHEEFARAFEIRLQKLRDAASKDNTEDVLAFWKKYMEKLEARPYTKLTTQETRMLVKDDALIKDLKTVDGAIYGHNISAVQSLENLKSYADRKFARKLEEVKHG